MSLHRAAVCTALLATACLKIPEFQGRGDGGGDDDGATSSDGAMLTPNAVTVTSSGGFGVVATLPGLYELKFSDEGYRFPYNWGIGAQAPLKQVLHAPADATCTLERDFGVAYLPAHVLASVKVGSLMPVSELTVDVPGPGIAKVRIEWSAMVACGATAHGRTTFSMFPDGRISRMDVANMASPQPSSGCGCAGAGAGDWRVYGFITFSRDVQTLQNETIPATSDAVGAPLTNAISCIEGSGAAYRIGVGWKNAMGGGMGPTRLRAPDGMSFALNGYITPPGSTLNEGALGDTTTTYWPSLTASCSALRTQIMPHTGPTLLEIDNGGGAVSIDMGQDGIYGGETAAAAPGRDTQGPMVTLRAPSAALGAFAVWLDFGVYKERCGADHGQDADPDGDVVHAAARGRPVPVLVSRRARPRGDHHHPVAVGAGSHRNRIEL